MLAAVLSFAASVIVAVLTAWMTSVLTVKRDREADWRKLRLGVYQEYIVALSGITIGRGEDVDHRRFADAVNSMQLVAPASVLNALSFYLAETSEQNDKRSDERHDKLLHALITAMRNDVSPQLAAGQLDVQFRLQAVPKGKKPGPSSS